MKYRIKTRFSDIILFPANAIEDSFYARSPKESFTFITIDGVECRARFLATWYNNDGGYDWLLDRYSKKYWNIPFSILRSFWFDRLGYIDAYWHMAELERI